MRTAIAIVVAAIVLAGAIVLIFGPEVWSNRILSMLERVDEKKVELAFAAFAGSIAVELFSFTTAYFKAVQPDAAATKEARARLTSNYDRVYLWLRVGVALIAAFVATMGLTPTTFSAFVLGANGLGLLDFVSRRVQHQDRTA